MSSRCEDNGCVERSVRLCDKCAPHGMALEEYTSPRLGLPCFVCGAPENHWYTNKDMMLRKLLIERAELKP